MPLSLGIGLGLAHTKGVGSLLSLFANGEDGFLYFPARPAYLFQDTSATTPVAADSDPVARFNDQSGKGKNATQGTTTKRPLWKENSGKPYLSLDGTDDSLGSTFVPGAGAAATIAFAGRINTASRLMLGGGISGLSQRCNLGINAAGAAAAGWGAHNITNIFGGGDIRGLDKVVLLTADANSVDLYVDGVQVYSAAPSGSVSGSVIALSVGANNDSGTVGSFVPGNLYGALALNRRVTAAEIALITSQFRSTFQ